MFGKHFSSSILKYLWYEVDFDICTLLKSTPECSVVFYIVFFLACILTLNKWAHDCSLWYIWDFSNGKYLESAVVQPLLRANRFSVLGEPRLSGWECINWVCSVEWKIQVVLLQEERLSKAQDFNMMSGLLKTYKPVRAVCCTTLAASSREGLD